MGSIGEADFTASPQIVSAHALLFDLDGTIIDSTAAVVKHWHKQGDLIGIDPKVILATSHGRRSIDVLKILSPERANWDYVCAAEALIPAEFGDDAEEIPGARKVLADLDAINAPWGIVTSGTRPLVQGWLGKLKLAHPTTLVTAEDVENGKPDPACYLLGLERLGLATESQIVVFEDAPSGIRAGKAAGFKVVGLTTTHTFAEVREAGADWIVQSLQDIRVKDGREGVIRIEVSATLP